ncbi:MAG: TatD family deoxyribonuclease [Gammaproteobacteria bacterium]|nr:MAG: TatD family deoxyribonuclease [Gammaproteobacteria bacterium]
MLLFDSHCHFDFEAFDNDRESLWHACNKRGVRYLIIPGVAPEQWQKADDVARAYNNIYIGVGLHPWWVEKMLAPENIENYLADIKTKLSANISLEKCVAVGECGLDAFIETPMQLQQQVLDVHLQLAQEIAMPLIIHCRKGHNELFVQLSKYNLPAGGVIHAFSGSYELAARYWSMGFRLGIGGTITYERANKTREAVKKLPLESLLLETDAPDMPLQGRQGQRNTPESISDIAHTLAELRYESLEKIATQTTLNSKTLFKIKH